MSSSFVDDDDDDRTISLSSSENDNDDDANDNDDNDNNDNDDANDNNDNDDSDNHKDMPPLRRLPRAKRPVGHVPVRRNVRRIDYADDGYTTFNPYNPFHFDVYPTAVLDDLVRAMSWDEYMRLASQSTIGYQRFLGIDPGARGEDAGDVLVDNLIYYEGVKEFLRRDYGIAYRASDCTALRTFERRMVAQALSRYAPPPKPDNDVSNLETLVKLRRLYVWLVALGRRLPYAANLLQRATDGDAYIQSFEADGLVVLSVAYAGDEWPPIPEKIMLAQPNRLLNKRVSVYMTLVDLFEIMTSSMSTREKVANLLARSKLATNSLPMTRFTSAYAALEFIYNDDGTASDRSYPSDAYNFVELDKKLFYFHEVFGTDFGVVTRFEGETGRESVPLVQVDRDIFQGTPEIIAPSLVVGVTLTPSITRSDILLANASPTGKSWIVRFHEVIGDENATTFYRLFSVVDERGRLFRRLVGVRQKNTTTRIRDEGPITYKAFYFAVVDIDINDDGDNNNDDGVAATTTTTNRGNEITIRDFRTYTFTTTKEGYISFGNFYVVRNQFLVSDNLFFGSLDEDVTSKTATVFDPEAGALAFYSSHNARKPIFPLFANDLANAPPLPRRWREWFTDADIVADGGNRLLLPRGDRGGSLDVHERVYLLPIPSTVEMATFRNVTLPRIGAPSRETVRQADEARIHDQIRQAILNMTDDDELSDNPWAGHE